MCGVPLKVLLLRIIYLWMCVLHVVCTVHVVHNGTQRTVQVQRTIVYDGKKKLIV